MSAMSTSGSDASGAAVGDSAQPDSAKRRRRESPTANDVPALWDLALRSVLPSLAQEHEDQLINAMVSDVQFCRKLMRAGAARLTHIPELADDDLAELVVCSVTLPAFQSMDEDELLEYDVDSQEPPTARHVTIRVKSLPYQLRMVLKRVFYEALSPGCMQERRANNLQQRPMATTTLDGRVEIAVSRNPSESFWECHEDWWDVYKRVLEDILECEIYECGLQHEFDSDVLRDCLPQTQEHTALHDAHSVLLDDEGERRVRSEFDDTFNTCFFETSWEQATPHTAGVHRVSADSVWVRKPRVRIVVSMTD